MTLQIKKISEMNANIGDFGKFEFYTFKSNSVLLYRMRWYESFCNKTGDEILKEGKVSDILTISGIVSALFTVLRLNAMNWRRRAWFINTAELVIKQTKNVNKQKNTLEL